MPIGTDMGNIADVEFPLDISYSSAGGPRFSTDVVTMASGLERRNRNWANARCEYDAATGIQSQDELAELITFFRARAGKAQGFLWKDWSDYTSAANGVDEPKATDQLIGQGDGSKTTFELVKNYNSGPSAHVRRIHRPVSGTVKVAVNGTPIPADNLQIVYGNGTVRFLNGPPSGVITAGYEFRVPCRFDTDLLSVRLDDYLCGSASVPIIEVKL